ncbi:MATE family efflux transporter [Romboutsia maritimum]|uniref:Multidrug export protein MepA n=1 Tax=Romboutsia maritimum TaxID=2020948 RepID=A0A371IPZ9_9FIRM|nr:MATE family efflux transporter [Romboutsia maritimum]RDY22542.1 MATE family efflux transporter [Romboutsia maritimum]
MKDEQILGTESIGRLLFKYSIPAIIGMVVNGLYNVVDRIFIGNIPGVGPLAITGLGVTMPIMTIILAFGMLIGIGTATNISIKLGQGKKDDAKKLIANSITLSIGIGIIITIIGIIFADTILKLFGASEKTLVYAKEYINIILIGSVVNILSFSLNHAIRADGSPKISAGIMIIGCLTNIVLDYILIFKFDMGIKGAAIATVLSQAITAFISLYYYLSGKSNLKFEKTNLKLDKELVKLVLAIGLSPFAMQLAASMVQIIANNSLKSYGGDLAIGAMTTISSIAMIFLMPIFGINQGSQPIIGFNYGAKKFKRVKKAYLISLTAATIILCGGTFIVQIFPEIIIGLFNKDKELMNISINGLRIYLLMLPIIGISITGTNYIQSIGKAKMAMLLSLLRQVILLIPSILILPKFFGLEGIWMSQPLSDFIATFITAIVLMREIRSYKNIELREYEVIKEKESIEINSKMAIESDVNNLI